jgi:hypothetical protein
LAVIETDGYLLAWRRYIELNPVRARLVRIRRMTRRRLTAATPREPPIP